MDDPGTDALRKLAPSWSLAGDEQLLSILQSTHQRLLSKCQEANSQLEQMATALNDASISLQNVNNQFMALSSSQFIESRVYDDDDLATDIPTAKEQPKPEIPDELTSLKHSISVLESAHEIITILQDSDTESDTDDEMPARMVLKPKDMYSSRPLPYIIGTQPWKNKWHAGLLLEDSDSDSSASKVEHDSDQYSQSEPEDNTDKLPVTHTLTHTTVSVSETSSEPPSEPGSVPKPTPSDVASEIARRLGAGREPPRMPEREPEEEEPPKPAARKIYRPQDPVPTTIFPDEPPPLSTQSDSEGDIFAELHRSQPYARPAVPDELFGADPESDDGDIFSDFAKKPTTNPSAKPPSLFDSGPAPHMFVKNTDTHPSADDHTRHMRDDRREGGDADDERVKKPIGGISLFGNKGTESIGAAILKRNQRKSSSSGEESESDSRSESQPNQQIRKEKDIFDDLFARSESKNVKKEKDFNKDLKTQIQKKVEVKEKKIEKPKVDLFSDNLFDDIDDIFSTNVVKMPAKDNSKSKSIFEDDDDLFSEIAAPKPVKIEEASSSNTKKGLFDSDDELFSESKPVEKPKAVEIIKPKVAERTKINEVVNKSKEITKSIFDDDEDDLFGDLNTTSNKVQSNKPVSLEKPQDFGKEDTKNIAPSKTLTSENVSKNIAPTKSNVFKSPSLFDDDDDDESDLFAEPTKPSVQNVKAASIKDTKLSCKTEVTPERSKEPSGKTEVKIPEDNVVIPSSSVKIDRSNETAVKHEKFDVNKEISKPLDAIDNTFEVQKTLEEEDSPVLPVNKNVDRPKENVESNAAKIFEHIQKHMEDSSSETNNDFSDQDFDDLPPKEDNNKPLINNSNIETKTEEISPEKPNIFDKVTLEEDIDELFVTAQNKTDNKDTIFKDIIPEFTETIPEKTEQDNKTAETATKTIEADIFSTIITEPPVFEKPKEPKKSKNVNALFDDDSDDESLFFKKNDPIFVENPQEFTPTQDRIFGLFTDEPPDDGFSKISDEFDDDMFSTLPKPKAPQKEYPPIPDTIHFDDNTSEYKIPEIEKVERRNDNTIPEIEKVDPNQDIFSDLPKHVTKTSAEIKKELNLNTDEDIFKLTKTENIVEQQKSPGVFSDEEQWFKKPADEPKPVSQKAPGLDFLSDDDNIFASKPKIEKPPIAQEKPKVEEKKVTSIDKPSLDLSDDENLFGSVPKPTLEKPVSLASKLPENKTLTSEEKSIPDLDLSDDDNLFASGPKLEIPTESKREIPVSVNEPKPTLKVKPTLDLSDDENLFASGSKSTSLAPSEHKQPILVNKNLTLEDKPSLDLSDDENLFGSGSKLENPSTSEKPAPVDRKLSSKVKSSLDLSDDDNLFASEKPSVVQEKSKNLESRNKSSDEELFSSLKTEIPKLTENKILKQDSKSDEELFKVPGKPEFVPKSSEIASEPKPEKSEKKVGKLKVGLNINVNALLPGASPKKVKPSDQPDGQSQSVIESQKSEPKIQPELPKSESRIESQNTDSKLLKSVSFEGEPESDILDNKLSKERAKIQVKRRPSTRRARREAVRKSGIDFGEDSTDNSSSIDDPPRRQPEVRKKDENPGEIRQDTRSENIDKSDVQVKFDDSPVQAKAISNPVEKQPKIEPAPEKTQPEFTEKPSYSRDVKSKVVYILNDEDIFNTSPVDKTESLNKNLDSNTGVTTLGKVYDKTVETSSKIESKSSLFGDENDEEIFKAKAVAKKSTIFDSDSEEDLFGTSKKEEKQRKAEKVEVKREIKREVVKGSLFGDEDDDDDLFGVKTKNVVDQKPQPSRSTAKETKETPKPAEPVFEDPLSMFGDDD